jgi:uncharacterized protein YgiM (DUF1202 family)
MIKLLLLLTLLLSAAVNAQNPKLLASCCDAPASAPIKSGGRCSGDASCTACTSCSSCKHCSKEGGSCGVCTTYSTPKKYNYTKKKAVRAPKSPDRYRKMQMIEVTSENLNVRAEASVKSKVLVTVHQGDMLTVISNEGEWLYVRVDASGTNGWVNYKYVK